MSTRILILIASLATAAPHLAYADGAAAPPAADLSQAKARFDRALVLYDQHDYTAALNEFQESYKLSNRWELLFNIALTQKKLFRYDASVATFRKYLELGGAKVPADRKAQVEAEQAETVKLTAQVTIVVDGEPAEIRIDDLSGWTTPIDHAVLLGSGEHTIIATRGALADTRKITIVSGQAAEVRLEPKPAAVLPGHLRITSRPAGASLSDGLTPLGTAPWEGDLEHGTHPITATLAGRADRHEDVHLDPGEHRDVVLQLGDLPPAPAPVYRRWYVLAAAGAVVVGGGVALYFATRTTQDVVIKFP